MSSILENVENGTTIRKRIHIKGASEIVLDSCDKFYDWKTNQIINITPEIK